MWKPSGRRLLEAIGPGRDRALDVGCGVLGWLRLLSRWVGPDGEVVGTDVDEAMLAAAARFVADEQLPNVILVKDDLFATSLEPASFDLVHARFELTPLGRAEEQLATYIRLTRHDGVVVLEDPTGEAGTSTRLRRPSRSSSAWSARHSGAGGMPRPAANSWSYSAASASQPTSEPRFWLFPPGIRTCGFRCSSRRLSRDGCCPSWTRWSWSGCARGQKQN